MRVQLPNQLMYINYSLILAISGIILFLIGLFGVKYYFINPQKKNLIHALVVGFLITIFSTVNILLNPYSIEFQIFVTWVIFFLLLVSSLNFENQLLVSFVLLIISLMLLFAYTIPVTGGKGSLVAYFFYASYFLVYHAYFTINKHFILRTKIILTTYVKELNLLKLILWIILVFIPSLFNNGFLFFFVLQSMMINSFFSGRYWIFYIMLGLWAWIVFLYIMNKYNLNDKFLRNLLNYFSRRACLHYIGNSFGAMFIKSLSNLNARTVVSAVIASGGFFAQALYPERSDMITDGNRAAHDTIDKITPQELSKYPKERQPLYIEYQKKTAFINEIQHRPHGPYCLDNKLIWYNLDNTIDKKKFTAFEQEMNAQKIGLSTPPKTLADIHQTFNLEPHNRCQEISKLSDDRLRLRTKLASANLFEHLKNTHFPQFSVEDLDKLSRKEIEELYRIYSERICSVLKDQATESFEGQSLEESSLNKASSHSSSSLETLSSFDEGKGNLERVASFAEESISEPATHRKVSDSSENNQSLTKPKSIQS